MSLEKLRLATYKVLDGADEFRIEIVGKFAGQCVRDVSGCWHEALGKNIQRQIAVDISRISGYDTGGKTLLCEMHRHGTVIAASTPSSLVFLQEITSARRTPAVLHEAPKAVSRPARTTRRSNAAASGE